MAWNWDSLRERWVSDEQLDAEASDIWSAFGAVTAAIISICVYVYVDNLVGESGFLLEFLGKWQKCLAIASAIFCFWVLYLLRVFLALLFCLGIAAAVIWAIFWNNESNETAIDGIPPSEVASLSKQQAGISSNSPNGQGAVVEAAPKNTVGLKQPSRPSSDAPISARAEYATLWTKYLTSLLDLLLSDQAWVELNSSVKTSLDSVAHLNAYVDELWLQFDQLNATVQNSSTGSSQAQMQRFEFLDITKKELSRASDGIIAFEMFCEDLQSALVSSYDSKSSVWTGGRYETNFIYPPDFANLWRKRLAKLTGHLQ